MIFLALLEYAILASTFTIAKVAVSYANPLFLIGVRMVIAAPLMFLLHGINKEKSKSVEKRDVHIFLLAGIFHIFLPFVAEFWALQYVTSSKAAIIYSLTPFIAAILSFFILKRLISFMQFLGLLIGLLGLLPILLSNETISNPSESFFVSLPELALLGAVSSASYGWFLVSDLMKRGYGISLINGIAMLFGGFLSLLVWFVFLGHENPIHGEVSQFMLWTLLLVMVANVIGYNFYGWLLKHISITMMSAVGFFCPVFASIYGYVFLNEQLTLWHLLALIMVGFGIWFFYKEEISKLKPVPLYDDGPIREAKMSSGLSLKINYDK